MVNFSLATDKIYFYGAVEWRIIIPYAAPQPDQRELTIWINECEEEKNVIAHCGPRTNDRVLYLYNQSKLMLPYGHQCECARARGGMSACALEQFRHLQRMQSEFASFACTLWALWATRWKSVHIIQAAKRPTSAQHRSAEQREEIAMTTIEWSMETSFVFSLLRHLDGERIGTPAPSGIRTCEVWVVWAIKAKWEMKEILFSISHSSLILLLLRAVMNWHTCIAINDS